MTGTDEERHGNRRNPNGGKAGEEFGVRSIGPDDDPDEDRPTLGDRVFIAAVWLAVAAVAVITRSGRAAGAGLDRAIKKSRHPLAYSVL